MVAARSSEMLIPACETTRRRTQKTVAWIESMSTKYLFNWGTFNDDASSSEYTVSNGRDINEQRIREDVEGSGRSLT
jgi:hypothetical protein